MRINYYDADEPAIIWRQVFLTFSDDYFSRRIYSSDLLPVRSRCLRKMLPVQTGMNGDKKWRQLSLAFRREYAAQSFCRSWSFQRTANSVLSVTDAIQVLDSFLRTRTQDVMHRAGGQ